MTSSALCEAKSNIGIVYRRLSPCSIQSRVSARYVTARNETTKRIAPGLSWKASPQLRLKSMNGIQSQDQSSNTYIPTAAPSDRYTQARHSSHSPLGAASSRKKVTLQSLLAMYKRDEPITMITAHDFPSAHVAEHAGMDMVLVGDSLAMVALGMEDTSEVVLEEMLLHCRSVSRGAKIPFIVGDLPMGSYEIDPGQALESAIRLVKDGRAHAVKLEGGAEMAPTIARITTAGIPVLAHIGLTPQRQHSLGGFRVQGKSVIGAVKLLEDAMAVAEAGAFGVVLEAVPADVATFITKRLNIPTIGIGAGNGTSGQVLVQVDMSGNFPPGRFIPKFVKKYGDVWSEALRALEAYGSEVKSRAYPAEDHTYPMPKEQFEEFKKLVELEESSNTP